MYVTGMLLCTVGAEVTNTPLNHSVVFVKEKDLFLTSDYWRIVVNFDLTAYEDATSTLREDLSQMEEITKRTFPIGELRHVESALSSLESKLAGLREFLPKADKRRGLIDAGGSILKALFGVATVVDLSDLHTTIDVMQRKEDSIVHSLNQQISYLKQLDGSVRFNYQAVANLSATLKGIVLKAQEEFQEVASKLNRNSRHIEAVDVIRQLEFALTQLELSVEELVDALQYVQLGKTPLNLIGPTMLREMLKNVTLILPEGYELIAGLRSNNVYLYYEIIQATMLADVHSFKLILYVPLKTLSRQYEMYRMVVSPTRIFNNTYVQFDIGKDYFGINLLQRSYLTLTEMDVVKCRGKDIMICPAEQAVYSTEVDSCALSLYFQSTRARETCNRKVISRPPQPRLERYGATVLYYLAEPQTLHLQCQQNRTWEVHSMTLEGGGFLENAESCYLTLQGLQLFPALRGKAEFSAQGPDLFIPTIPAVVSTREEAVLQQMSFTDESKLEQLATSISSHPIEADINTLFHLHASSQQYASKSNGITLGLIAASVVLTLFILYYFTQAYIWNLMKNCLVNWANTEIEDVQKPQTDIPTPSQPNPSSAVGEDLSEVTPQIRFSAYSMQTV